MFYQAIRFDHDVSDSEYEETMWDIVEPFDISVYQPKDNLALLESEAQNHLEELLVELKAKLPYAFERIDMTTEEVIAIVERSIVVEFLPKADQ